MLMVWPKSLTLLFRLLTGAGIWREEQPERKTPTNIVTYSKNCLFIVFFSQIRQLIFLTLNAIKSTLAQLIPLIPNQVFQYIDVILLPF